MNLAIRDSASRVADAAREIGGDVATALAWLEAARSDISRNRPSVSHAPDAVRVPAARGPCRIGAGFTRDGHPCYRPP